MKKVVLLIIVAAAILVAVAVWVLSAAEKVRLYDYLNMAVVLVLVAFALFAGYKRFSSLKRGEPAEDEMSKRVMKKAASLSYYISIYLWLLLMYFSDRIPYEKHTVIGIGITGMAVVFGICWLVYQFRGARNE